MLEQVSSFVFHILIWALLLFILVLITIMGFEYMQYNRFSAAIQETLARSGPLHRGGGDPAVINNPEVIKMIHKYGNRWVIEPIPNLSAVDGTTLSPNGVKAYFTKGDLSGSQQQKVLSTINLSDFEKPNGQRISKLTPGYLYRKTIGTSEASKDVRQRMANDYNAGRNTNYLSSVKPQYFDFDNFDAQYLVNHTPSYRDKNNELNRVTWMNDGSGYSFPNFNSWSWFVRQNVKGDNSRLVTYPVVKYGGDVSYMIVPNVNTDGKLLGGSIIAGGDSTKQVFGWSTKLINGQGHIYSAKNQIRSEAAAKLVDPS